MHRSGCGNCRHRTAPETAPARRAGLTINRGVCVDSYLQTSNADIYALGDCAEINGQILPFLQPIQLSAMVLAKNLLGNNTPLKLPAMLVKIKTPELPLHLAGETQRQDLRWHIYTERREWWRAALTMLTSFAPLWSVRIG